jgi:hypothetical protein
MITRQILAADLPFLDSPTPGNQLKHHNDNRDHEQKVDEPSSDMKHESPKYPENEQDDGDRPQHERSSTSHLSDLSKT